MTEATNLPRHVAIIMDGNGRWATKRKLPRVMGHNAGMKAMREIVRRSSDLGVQYLTVYAFSTENWKRTQEEIGGIFGLLIKYVNQDLEELHKENVRVNILGDWSIMPENVREALGRTIFKTRNNTGLTFNIALNYGSRDEVVRGVRELAEMVKAGALDPADIDEESISKHLYTGKFGVPDPDLIIRPGGEVRLSNYLMWQAAYAELYFCDTLWPDFTPDEYETILRSFGNRERRFGGRNE